MSGLKNSILALIVSAPMVCATPALAVEWDFATINPATNYQTEAAEKFAAEVAVATKNGVKISVHAGGALGFKGPDMLGAVRDGLVPIGSMLINQQVGLSPILGVSSLPYLVSGIDEMKTFRDTSRSIFQNEFAKYNQKLLFVVPWPGQNIFSKSELSKAETFRAMKIRTLDRNGSEFFRNLGASPAQIPWGEVVPALATGVIDSVTTSSSSAVDGQFWEFLKFCTIVNWQSNFEAVSVNLDAWNKISPKDQKIIEQAAENVEAEFWTTAKAEDSKNFETLKSKGVQVVDAPPAVRDFMLEKGKPTWAAFAQSVPAAKSLIEKYLAATGK